MLATLCISVIARIIRVYEYVCMKNVYYGVVDCAEIKRKIAGGGVECMSIENRVISLLQSAIRADVLPDGYDLDSPFTISTINGLLMSSNDAFQDLVANRNLMRTHYRERCPTRCVERLTEEMLAKTANLGYGSQRRPILGYDGKLHDITYEMQLVGIGGKAYLLSSIFVEGFDIGKIPAAFQNC